MVIAPIRWSGEALAHFAAKNPHTCLTDETNASPAGPSDQRLWHGLGSQSFSILIDRKSDRPKIDRKSDRQTED